MNKIHDYDINYSIHRKYQKIKIKIKMVII